MGELVVVVCAAGEGRCDTSRAAVASRESAVRARFEEARALLEPAGLWVDWPVLVLDARLSGALATTFEDAAREGLVAYPGRPVVFFDTSAGAVPELDVVLHELTHVWLRAAGAGDARWRLDRAADLRKEALPTQRVAHASGRASHESALVHEGVSDFVAAALTGDSIIGEGYGVSSSLRVEAKCPDDLTGSPHADAVLVSGALWELGGAGRDANAMNEVLSAVRRAAVDGSRDVASFVGAVSGALAGRDDGLSTRWAELVERRGLTRCGDPIALGVERFSARTGELIAAGSGRFSGAGSGDRVGDRVGGPLGFSARVGDSGPQPRSVKIMARSSEADALAVDWRALGPGGDVLDAGRAPLMGWPSQWASVVVPASSHSLDFVFTTNASNDIAYNDVRVTWELATEQVATEQVATEPATAAETAPRSGCGVGVAGLELWVALVGAWVGRRSRPQRFSRARTSDSGSSRTHP